jgi:hypothetical protein
MRTLDNDLPVGRTQPEAVEVKAPAPIPGVSLHRQ